jgi:hypothetical protein
MDRPCLFTFRVLSFYFKLVFFFNYHSNQTLSTLFSCFVSSQKEHLFCNINASGIFDIHMDLHLIPLFFFFVEID